MYGIWKEKISGWNHKDSKRKKVNRKQNINSKIEIYRKLSNNIRFPFHNKKIQLNFYISPLIETEYKKNLNCIQKKSEVYLISYKINCSETIICKAYEYNSNLCSKYSNKKWVNYETGYFIDYLDNVKVTKLKFITNVFFNYDNEKKYSEKTINESECSKEYIYGKPLGFCPEKRKFHTKKDRKFVRKSERTSIKNWIKNNDFDKPLKYIYLSKNIEEWFEYIS